MEREVLKTLDLMEAFLQVKKVQRKVLKKVLKSNFALTPFFLQSLYYKGS